MLVSNDFEMIKKTLYFGNPCYLRREQEQLVVEFPDGEQKRHTVPIEDAGIVILDHQRITITQGLLAALSENNTVVVNCDHKHMPFSLLLPAASHHAFTEKLRYQMEASLPLKKNLWQQTIIAKIRNQAALLDFLGLDSKRLTHLANQVKSDDNGNCEARAAAWYWDMLIKEPGYRRHRYGDPPNNLLNYGYSILRSVCARSLVGSGLLLAIGIHHRNKYNPFCLADDIMEPYRPWVDRLVVEISVEFDDLEELTREMKSRLLTIPAIDVRIGQQKSPLMVAMRRTTASLMDCYEGLTRKLLFPDPDMHA